jgi:microcin C transport system permease protein
VWSSAVIVVAYAVPGFLFAIFLIVFFAGGTFFDWFPAARAHLRQLGPDVLAGADRRLLWHLALPLLAMALAAFATTTLLTKNSFPRRDPQAVCGHAPRQGPFGARRALWPRLPQRHAADRFRLSRARSSPPSSPVAAHRVHLLLDGLGLLGFESRHEPRLSRVFATLYIFSLLGLVVQLISDLTYTWIDPRIDFESREV